MVFKQDQVATWISIQITRVSNTQFTIADSGGTSNWVYKLSKGTILRWLQSGSPMVAVVSNAVYLSNVVTVTLFGDILASGYTNMSYTNENVIIDRFPYNGNISSEFADVMKVFYYPIQVRILAVELNCTAGAGGSGSTTIDVKVQGVTILPTKLVLSNIATNVLVGTNNNIVAVNNKVTLDITTILTAPTTYHSDAEVVVYAIPYRYLFLP